MGKYTLGLAALFALGTAVCSGAPTSPYSPRAEQVPPPATASSQTPELLRQASAESAPTLVIFGASWCAPCRVLDRDIEATLAETPVEERKTIIYHIPAETDADRENANAFIVRQWGIPGISGLPAYFALTDEQPRARGSGYAAGASALALSSPRFATLTDGQAYLSLQPMTRFFKQQYFGNPRAEERVSDLLITREMAYAAVDAALAFNAERQQSGEHPVGDVYRFAEVCGVIDWLTESGNGTLRVGDLNRMLFNDLPVARHTLVPIDELIRDPNAALEPFTK